MEQMLWWLSRPFVMFSFQTDSGVKTTHRALSRFFQPGHLLMLSFKTLPLFLFFPRKTKQIKWQDFWLFNTCDFSFSPCFWPTVLSFMVNIANGSSVSIRAMILEMLTGRHQRSSQPTLLLFYILKEFGVLNAEGPSEENIGVPQIQRSV